MNSQDVSIPSSNTMLRETTALTDWVKEPKIETLKGDLEASKSAHDIHVSKVKHWDDLRNVTGSAKPKTLKGRSAVQPKLIRRQAEWRYSALSEPFLSSEKLFKVEPATFEDELGAKQNELLLNHQFRTKIDKVKFVDEYVRTSVDEGSVIVRCGWERHTIMVKEKVPVMEFQLPKTEAEVQPLQEAIILQRENPRAYSDLSEELKAAVDYYNETGEPTIAVIAGEEVVEKEKVLINQPTIGVLNPANVFLDPSCEGDFEKSRFVIISWETSQAELIKDGRYKNLDKINWSGNTVLATPDHVTNTPDTFSMHFNDDLRKRVVAYEYFGYQDIDGTGILKPILAVWIGDVLIRLEENPFPDELPPIVVVPYLPVKRQVTGEPDAEILEDNQKILGAVTRGMIDLMGRSANAQIGFAKNFLDVTNKRRYQNGEDYEFNPGNGDPRGSVFQHTYPEIPNSALVMANLQNQEAEALTGVKSFSGGMSGEAYGQVAAGIRGMLDAASKREMNILRRLASGMVKIGKKIIAMNAVFLSEEEVVRITNEQFVTVKREELAGNYDLIVDIATAEVEEAKSQDLGFMLQTMGPNMDPEMSRLILAEIATLKRMPVLAKKIQSYKPQPDPLVERLKELEIKKAEKELEKLDSEIVLNQAKAKQASAMADRADLDFVEQESGTKHARDLQKQGQQARSNQDLAVTKALVTPRKEGEREPDVAAAIGYNELSDIPRSQR